MYKCRGKTDTKRENRTSSNRAILAKERLYKTGKTDPKIDHWRSFDDK
jgi:hypothetical protein